MRPLATSVFALLVLSIVACADDPRLAAEGTGDLSNALAARNLPDSMLIQACGEGLVRPEGVPITRRPYLQSVTARSARVLFSSRIVADFSVTVSLPDGTPVQSVPAVVDRRARPVRGAALREARLGGLEPDTTYCYAVDGATERAGFHTPPDLSADAPVRFVVLGDSGSGNRYQAAIAEQMQTVPYDFVLHAGDIAYEDGTRDELEGRFFDMYPSITRSFSVFPVLGNHDRATEGGAAFREAFRLPDGPDGAEDAYHYSFDWGPIHFVAVDTNRIDTAHATWLEADLARNEQRWTIVFGHAPPFSSGEHGPDGLYQRLFVPLLEKYHVPLVISGHEHDYERTRPIHGITYIVTGGGGRGTRPVSQSDFTAYSEDVLHFVFVEVDGPTIVVHAIDGVGREFDQTRIELGTESPRTVPLRPPSPGP